LERKLGETEQNLQKYMIRMETLTRELKDTRIEMLSNQCDQLAKNRLMRREFRVLFRRISNTVAEQQNTEETV